VRDCLPEPETRRATNVASRTHEVGVGAGSSGVLMLAARRTAQRIIGPGQHRTSQRKRQSVLRRLTWHESAWLGLPSLPHSARPVVFRPRKCPEKEESATNQLCIGWSTSNESSNKSVAARAKLSSLMCASSSTTLTVGLSVSFSARQ